MPAWGKRRSFAPRVMTELQAAGYVVVYAGQGRF